jgi:hypothetical protein
MDVYDFMVKLKDLDLNGWENSKCDCSGAQIPADCAASCVSGSA